MATKLQPAVDAAIELARSGMSVTDAVENVRVRFELVPADAWRVHVRVQTVLGPLWRPRADLPALGDHVHPSNVADVVESVRRSQALIADALLKLGDARRIIVMVAAELDARYSGGGK